jgi:hypothetical protein
MYVHAFPIRIPSDVLEALGEHTGHFWLARLIGDGAK